MRIDRDQGLRRAKAAKEAKVVWRITAAHPEGEYVSASAPRAAVAQCTEEHERGHFASSLELWSGAEVVETPMDALPEELIHAFEKARR